MTIQVGDYVYVESHAAMVLAKDPSTFVYRIEEIYPDGYCLYEYISRLDGTAKSARKSGNRVALYVFRRFPYPVFADTLEEIYNRYTSDV
jgi:hypothetical protein